VLIKMLKLKVPDPLLVPPFQNVGRKKEAKTPYLVLSATDCV